MTSKPSEDPTLAGTLCGPSVFSPIVPPPFTFEGFPEIYGVDAFTVLVLFCVGRFCGKRGIGKFTKALSVNAFAINFFLV